LSVLLDRCRSFAAEHFRRLHEPVLGRVHGARQLAAAADGSRFAYVGELRGDVLAPPALRIQLVDAHGTCTPVAAGADDHQLPAFSPDGRRLAFVSAAGGSESRLRVWDVATAREVGDGLRLSGIEAFSWSADGHRLLVRTAGANADIAGARGSGAPAGQASGRETWWPVIETSRPADMWRRVWIWTWETGTTQPVEHGAGNIWEAAWCGTNGIVAVVSDEPREGSWYRSRLEYIPTTPGAERRVLFQPDDEEIGLPGASLDGRWVSIVAACASDRTSIAGDIVLIDRTTGDWRRLAGQHVDVTCLHWRDAETLFYIGISGFSTVAAEVGAKSGAPTVLWRTTENCGPERYPDAVPIPDGFALIQESYGRFPAIASVRNGVAGIVTDLASGAGSAAQPQGRIEPVTWTGRDDLELHGYLLRPHGDGPFPLVMFVHGGPVTAFRDTWSVRYPFPPLFVEAGYAVFLPNPRGSTGRGQAFARLVRGDMGGEDSYDLIRGVEHLVARGIADPARLGVCGRSYGGFMSAWLPTLTSMFAAAMPMAPTTDWVSQHLTSNIPEFDEIFLRSRYDDGQGLHWARSPVFRASLSRTPSLNVAGGQDRCTPAGQALEFHRALAAAGVESELLVYPNEGHHVRNPEALIDLCGRLLAWLARFMPSDRGPGSPLAR
jgi:dipeptidyl aminopeptidase/acylaminoacyl peptidase